MCLFIAMICISLYQINYNQDSKVYKYYKEIIADYNNIKNDINSISNNMISSLVEDEDKNLWIGTDGGLNKMNLITGDITRYLVSDDDKVRSNTVVDELLIDSK